MIASIYPLSGAYIEAVWNSCCMGMSRTGSKKPSQYSLTFQKLTHFLKVLSKRNSTTGSPKIVPLKLECAHESQESCGNADADS